MKLPNTEFHKNPFSYRVVTCGQTDRHCKINRRALETFGCIGFHKNNVQRGLIDLELTSLQEIPRALFSTSTLLLNVKRKDLLIQRCSDT
jgi:hypothetical protein